MFSTEMVIKKMGESVDSAPMALKYPHYFKDVRHLDYIDVYRILDLFEVTDQMIAHVIKKLLAAGQRGAKDAEKDIDEAFETLLRRKEMRREDAGRI